MSVLCCVLYAQVESGEGAKGHCMKSIIVLK